MDQLDRANIVLHLPQAFIPLNSLGNFLKQLEIIISIFKKTGNLVPRGAGQLDSGFKASSWHSWGLSPGYVLLNTTVRRRQTKKNPTLKFREETGACQRAGRWGVGERGEGDEEYTHIEEHGVIGEVLNHYTVHLEANITQC